MDNFTTPSSQRIEASYSSQSEKHVAPGNFQQCRSRGQNFNYGYRKGVKRCFYEGTPQTNYQSKYKRCSDSKDERKTNFQSQNHTVYRGRGQNYGKRQNFDKNKTDKFDVTQYFHPSMLEDPWKDLLDDGNVRKAANSNGKKKEESKTEDNWQEDIDSKHNLLE